MKNSVRFLIPALLGGALVTSAFATTTTVARRDENKHVTVRVSDPVHVRVVKGEAKGPLEKVTFLGVETGPLPEALASQLGLERDLGLVVRHVAEKSPAAEALKEHDVLTKFGDQLLVDARQLGVLVRAKKPGDEVKLTLFRGGKETVVSVKLGENEAPRVAIGGMAGFPGGEGFRFVTGDGEKVVERLRELPGAGREEIDNAIRIIGRERGNWFAAPRVHIVRRNGGGSSLLNMAEGNFVYSDDEGAIEISAAKGERELTVKDAKGAVTFKGPITSDEQRDKLPADVKKRLRKIDSAEINFEADESLEQEGAAVKPAKTKTRLEIERVGTPAPGHSPRSF